MCMSTENDDTSEDFLEFRTLQNHIITLARENQNLYLKLEKSEHKCKNLENERDALINLLSRLQNEYYDLESEYNEYPKEFLKLYDKNKWIVLDTRPLRTRLRNDRTLSQDTYQLIYKYDFVVVSPEVKP